MCGRRLLWEREATDPLTILHRVEDFIAPLRAHAGWDIDWRTSRAIFSELVANVVEHSPGPIRVVLDCDDTELCLRVEDAGDVFELRPRLPSDRLSEGGRGLFIVSQYAAALRVEPIDGRGKAVIAALPRAAPVTSA